jgi:acetyl-CoA carboxylase biotin carboxyl carrier protein
MKLTNEDVEEILRLLDGAGYDELLLETTNFTLSLSRAGEDDWTQQHAITRKPVIDRAAPGVDSQTGSGHTVATAGDAQPAEAQHAGLEEVRAPLPGTFYRAARPGAAPFVDVGASVEPVTVIGIVETMKLMNSVHAGVAGVVEQIVTTNAQPVAQGAVLMRIRPSLE